ncbi:MAG: 16S rRNA (uracil(1498)-N(3))-methyltransferase [Alphaproteobacteria bacterium]|nr:16S rRNA (uracil(1498)-N(3))-methyltransferase [Alphaproteobacteria bacterium]
MKRVRVASLPHDGPLDAGVSHHLLHVLRARPGLALVLFDGAGSEQPAELVADHDGLAIARATGPVRTVSAEGGIDLVVAILKHQAMDLAIRMATEAGVRGIHPVLTERSVAKGERTDRWERITSAAAAQCGRADEPVIHPVRRLREAVEGLETPVYAALPGGPLAERAPGTCAVCVGPEGGFSPAEVAWLSAHVTPVGLGPHVYRAETACVVAVALLRPVP